MDTRTVVLLIDDLHEWTGTEIHLLRLLRRVDRSRLRFILAVVGRADLAGEFRSEGITVHPLEIYRTFAPSGLHGIVKVAALLRREQASLLVTYHTASDLLGPFAARMAGVPVLSCRRDEGFTKRPIHVAAQRPVNLLVHGMISNSHSVVRAVQRSEGFPKERNQVIWNGEDLESYAPGLSRVRKELGLYDNTCVITSVGLLSPVKDNETAVDAFSRIVKRHQDSCLLLVGDGPERARLEARAAPLGDKVRFLGHRQDVPEILRTTDIYLQTSLSEGFSNAILQAMATQLPVIVTGVGGNTELVTKETGLFVPPRDPAAVADALGLLVRDPKLRRKLGMAARRRAEACFSLDRMVEAYTDAFERAIEDRFPGLSSGARVVT
jgi:glycosyltransferase involved in cell wall biosynthesis